MHRLRCGVIYTNAFADYLAQVKPSSEPGRILALDYVRVASGRNKGSSWWRMEWLPEDRIDESCRFVIGVVPVFLSRQCQRGLRDRCLDCRDGEVWVRG